MCFCVKQDWKATIENKSEQTRRPEEFHSENWERIIFFLWTNREQNEKKNQQMNRTELWDFIRKVTVYMCVIFEWKNKRECDRVRTVHIEYESRTEFVISNGN